MEDSSSDNHHHEYFMSLALKVAQSALSIGEVPVGCVIVLREFDSIKNDDTGGIVVSHGANQVNATRDATRHAECVAIDRMLIGGLASDQARLPAEVIVRNAHGDIPSDCNLDRAKVYKDHWTDVVSDNPDHSKNRSGWGSGRTYKPDIFQKCDLYVTCEPCIMCAAALAKIGIGRVFFGCKNDRFGGCGSLMNLHESSALPSEDHRGYPVVGGIMEKEAIHILRSFYNRENFHAPEDKRKRKPKEKNN